MKISHLAVITVLIGFLFCSPLIMATQYASESASENTAKSLPDNEGIIISTIDTTGYTYMELENNGDRFWIAAPTTQVKVGDHIRFVESMVMTNFSSPTLNRTFRRIIFVSSTMIKK